MLANQVRIGLEWGGEEYWDSRRLDSESIHWWGFHQGCIIDQWIVLDNRWYKRSINCVFSAWIY